MRSEPDDRRLESSFSELALDALHFVLVVVGPEAHAEAHDLVGQKALLNRCLPTGEGEARLQILSVGLG